MQNEINKDSNSLSSPTNGQEAIILAGGLGTRLRNAVPDLPKCMAPVAGRPFIAHVIDYLRMQGVQHFIFSLGYKSDVIESYLINHYPTLDYSVITENEPLGTGGAIHLAIQKARDKNVLIANGDTLFKADVKSLLSFHFAQEAECTLALKPMHHFDRYGVVETNENGRIISFKEKQFYENGLINGGIYILNKEKFLSHSFDQKFSFEKDYLERYYTEGNLFGSVQQGYFIDIGIPEDYNKAQTDLQQHPLHLKKIDKSWTLFLDRDGVINDEKIGEYVLHWGEFIFSKGVLETFKKLSDVFGKIIVVSNQRGVGKGLMTETDLQTIHLEMHREVEIVGGKIDRIYYCTEKDDKCFNRKPNPGMALQATQDFPDIDLTKTIMVGNKPSDMRFGRAAGMFTVFVATTNPDQPFPHNDIDLRFDSLSHFAEAL
jgi:D-glycero-alpha-D-manno-heptose 1-phosphate guanylyltransferase